MPSALNACTAWPRSDCIFVGITRGPMTSLLRIPPSIRAAYYIWGITKCPQHPTSAATTGGPWPSLACRQQPRRPACPPTFPSMPITPLTTCKEPRVSAPMPYGLCLETLCSPVTCLPWQRWHSESHTWGVNICHCEPSLCCIGCQEESHQVGKTHDPPRLSLAAGLSQRPR